MKIVELDLKTMLTRVDQVKNALIEAEIDPDLLTLGALIIISERMSASHGVAGRLVREGEKPLAVGFLSPMPKRLQ